MAAGAPLAPTAPPSPQAAFASTDTPQATDRPVMRLGIVSFYNPRLMYMKYQPLADYLSRRTPWRVELDLSSSYQKTVERLCGGQLQVAYLGPFSHVRAVEACGARPLVRLNTGGHESYRAYVMVRQDSRIKSLADLRGSSFGFGARLSTSSHLLPRAMLLEAGLHPTRDYTCKYYAHHERAARAVLMGEVAACGIRDVVGEQFRTRGLRVLAQSDPVPNFPLAAGPATPPDFATAVVRALIDDPRAKAALAREMEQWDPELSAGFRPVAPDAYASVVRLAQRVFGPAALTMPPERLDCGSAAPER